MDSMWHKLKGTFNVLCSFVKSIKGRKVRHRIDNQNIVCVLTNGSKKLHLQAVTMDIFKLCIENNINLFPEWVHRSENETVDWKSKDLDKDDYMLNSDIFAVADTLWGPHTVDRFSSFKARQVPRLCSRRVNNCMQLLDAFSARWSGENNWLFPPPYLIPKMLRHLQWSLADGRLLGPWWRTAPWWPLFILPDTGFRSEVIDFLVVEPKVNKFIRSQVYQCLMIRHQIFHFCSLGYVFVRTTIKIFEKSCYLLPTESCFPIVIAFPGFSAQFSECINHEDKEIRALASELPCILMQDLSFSTIKKYFGVFQKWETWAKQEKVSVIPTQPIFFNLFLLSQIKKETWVPFLPSVWSLLLWLGHIRNLGSFTNWECND